MRDQVQRKPLVSGIDGLRRDKRQILDAAAGRLPEHLVRTTARVVAQLTRREAPLAEIVSERVCELVRQSLKGLRRREGKPDTALWLHRRLGEGRHGLSQ
jgi:hypothetical protein